MLNIHFHVLAIDGVFAPEEEGVRFHPAAPLTATDVADVLGTIVPRVRGLLDRRGFGADDEGSGVSDQWADEAPVLAGLAEDNDAPCSASVMRARTALISTQPSACRRGSAIVSSACAGTHCGRPSRRTASV